MTALVLLGAGLGLGLVLVVASLRPYRPPLSVLEGLNRPAPVVAPTPGSPLMRLAGSLAVRLGVGRLAVRLPLEADLRVAATTLEEHLAARVLAAVAGLVLPLAATAVLATGGIRLGWLLPVWVSLALAAAGFFLPLVLLRAEAAERRASFRHALSSYLDMVAVSLAGGQGVDQAVTDTAGAGRGWVFTELRQALAVARLNGRAPWDGLDRLGAEMGLPELREVAATCGLAGDEGARVRSSIAAKARTLRSHALAAAEEEANRASEQMTLPLVMLLFGYVLFLGYPALSAALGGL